MTPDRPPPPDPALREVAMRHLAISFPESRLEDREDMAQGAYEAMLTATDSGETFVFPEQWIKKVSWTAYLDEHRPERSAVHRAEPFGPSDETFRSLVDESSEIEEQLIQTSERARAEAIVSQMKPRQQATYRIRFVEEMTNVEGAKMLGVSERTYYRELQKLIEEVTLVLEPDTFAVVQRELLLAYLAGGPAEKCEAGRRLIEKDPQSFALATMLMREHRQLGRTIPELAIVLAAGTGVFATVAAAADSLRDRLPGGGGEAAQVASSGEAGAGIAGGGVIALGGAGAKIAALCGTAAVGAVACIAGVVPGIEGIGGGKDRPEPQIARVKPAPAPEPKPMPVRPLAAAPPPPSASNAPSSVPDEPNRDAGSDSGAPSGDAGTGGGGTEAPAAAPPETVQQEFDPLAGSPTPAAPAPAPSSGGSSGGDGATAAAIAGEEFGP